ncbi:MAG: NAD(P)H-binding protein [Bacteroides graminisolvens]|nr:NAD(P)H-binding protein [Bacteroides graminisolvens]
MKNVVLIGASGFVGTALLNELLKRGHRVTALVRNPDKINAQSDQLEVVMADVADVEQVANLCKGKDAVVSAYNPGWTNPNIYEDTLRNYTAILEAVRQSGVKRLLCVGGAGTLFCAPGVRLLDAGVLPQEIMPGVKSLGEFYLGTLMNEKEVDWVFFSPAGNLEPGDATGVYRLGKDDLIVDAGGQSRITVGDYALAMVNELDEENHHRERFTIGY